MKAVIQRVRHGAVTVAGERIAEIDAGVVILIGVKKGDTPEQADWLAEKIANLRIFEDDAGKMNRSVLEAGGSALVVSQFTLYGNALRGRRPDFFEAALPSDAETLLDYFTRKLRFHGVPTQTGRFRAEMLVEISNDGPVTIVIEK